MKIYNMKPDYSRVRLVTNFPAKVLCIMHVPALEANSKFCSETNIFN